MGDMHLQLLRLRLHLPDHRPLVLGAGRVPRPDGQRGPLPARRSGRASTTSRARRSSTRSAASWPWRGRSCSGPRLGRRFKRDGGGADAAARPDDRGLRRPAPLVRLVRLQPRQHPLGDGLPGRRAGSRPTRRWPPARAGLMAMIVAYFLRKKWDVSFTVNGFLAGLVAITCPCYWVSPAGSLVIGAVAGVRRRGGRRAARMPADRRPDRRGARARDVRHLGHALARPVRQRPVRPDRPADRPITPRRRSPGSSTAAARRSWRPRRSAARSSTVCDVRRGPDRHVRGQRIGQLRVAEEGELHGLDLYEHGISAYPEYVITAAGSPSGTPPPIHQGAGAVPYGSEYPGR